MLIRTASPRMTSCMQPAITHVQQRSHSPHYGTVRILSCFIAPIALCCCTASYSIQGCIAQGGAVLDVVRCCVVC